MYNALVHAHSGLRWVALGLLLFAIFNSIKNQTSGRYEKKDKMINLFAMVFLHIQLLIGLGLFFMNDVSKVSFSEGWMKIPMFRFFGLEHILGMVLAITIVTIGRKKAEKLTGSRDKHRKIMVYYFIGLVLILASIPWPFREALGGKWM
jgi:nitric oxide reductase large subunit